MRSLKAPAGVAGSDLLGEEQQDVQRILHVRHAPAYREQQQCCNLLSAHRLSRTSTTTAINTTTTAINTRFGDSERHTQHARQLTRRVVKDGQGTIVRTLICVHLCASVQGCAEEAVC